MRSFTLLTLALLALPERSVAQREPAPASDLEAIEAKLLTRIGPQTRAWIIQEAAREIASNTVSEATAVHAVRSVPHLGSMGDADIMALAFIVMMEAAKSAREDLKSIMAGVKAINAAKADFRESTSGSSARARRVPDSLDRREKAGVLRLQAANDRQAKIVAALSMMVQKIPVGPPSLTQYVK